jgi:hypothetical protein
MIIVCLMALKYRNSSEEDGIHDHILPPKKTKEKCQEKTIIFRINISKNPGRLLQSHQNELIMQSVMFANVITISHRVSLTFHVTAS